MNKINFLKVGTQIRDRATSTIYIITEYNNKIGKTEIIVGLMGVKRRDTVSNLKYTYTEFENAFDILTINKMEALC